MSGEVLTRQDTSHCHDLPPQDYMNDALLRSSHIAAIYGRTFSSADGIVNKTPSPGLIHEAHVACWLAVGNVYGHVDWVALRQEIVLNHLSASSPVLSVVYDCTYLYPTWSPACRR